ncbi:MAG: hypothetical protein DRG83_00210 [Deltaproteobacteria bacterium]|nr:MAG: hypothetical protein DRG83_00210 [Deltaproteobacteria bacterium]
MGDLQNGSVLKVNPSEKYEEVCEKLNHLCRAFAMYCHAENCKEIYECPFHKKECRQKLGLDTSLAWEVKSLLSYIRFSLRFQSELEIIKKDVRIVWYIISVLQSIIYRHFDEFKGLGYLLNNTVCLLRKFYEDIDERRKQ